MIEATVYDASGRIQQVISVLSFDELMENLPQDALFLLGRGDGKTQYVKGHELRLYPPRPGPWAAFDIATETWKDPRSIEEVGAAYAAELAARRAGMTCSRMQGIIALGEARWATVLAYRDEPTTTFAERAIIDGASVWRRLSENIAFFAYLLGLDDAAVDALFDAAMAIEA